MVATQAALRQVQQRIVGVRGDDFGVFDKALQAHQQVGLSVQRAGLPNGKTDLGLLAQALDPVGVVIAAAEHFHFKVARVAEQLVLQLADYPVLEPEQQQQRGDHRHQRRGDAKRNLAVMPEVFHRQRTEQAEATNPWLQSVFLPDD